jgi:hypothetical protein
MNGCSFRVEINSFTPVPKTCIRRITSFINDLAIDLVNVLVYVLRWVFGFDPPNHPRSIGFSASNLLDLTSAPRKVPSLLSPLYRRPLRYSRFSI